MSETTERPRGNLDVWAWKIVKGQWMSVFGQEATPYEIEAVCAVARLESNYGWPAQATWAGHHNWGAMQGGAPSGGTCPAGTFPATDSHASGQQYVACEAEHATNEEGARALMSWFAHRPAVSGVLGSGDATRIAQAMHSAGYFEAPVATYAKAIATNAAGIARSFGREPYVRLVAPKVISTIAPIIISAVAIVLGVAVAFSREIKETAADVLR